MGIASSGHKREERTKYRISECRRGYADGGNLMEGGEKGCYASDRNLRGWGETEDDEKALGRRRGGVSRQRQVGKRHPQKRGLKEIVRELVLGDKAEAVTTMR